MDSDYSSLPAGKQIQITIAVNNAPPSSVVSPPRFHNTTTGLYSLNLIVLNYLLNLFFIQMKSEYDKLSPFKTHTEFMIISIVALFVALASGILMYTERFLKSPMTDIHFRILELIIFFSGFLATVSLLLVFILSQNQNWVGFIVISVILLIIAVCYFSGCIGLYLQIKETETRDIHINYSTTLMPLPIMLMLFVPSNLNWIKFSVDGLTIVTVVGYNIFAYIRSVKKKNALNSEKLIKVNQQDDGKIIPLVA